MENNYGIRETRTEFGEIDAFINIQNNNTISYEPDKWVPYFPFGTYSYTR